MTKKVPHFSDPYWQQLEDRGYDYAIPPLVRIQRAMAAGITDTDEEQQ